MEIRVARWPLGPRAFVVAKRFYNPPTTPKSDIRAARKSWSKQHPDFRTRRPLVEPYNLGRLHPEKEWWKLPRKGLSPQTFMGFPDVAHIEKRGGALYTHLMDGHTLCMVVYRCIDKDVRDFGIWRSLAQQALNLAMGLDPYIVSLLFLYFSRSDHYDYRFVATFTGRILATLSQFKLHECYNVLLAMENEQYLHELTKQRVTRHAEALCLGDARSIPVEDALRMITVARANTPEVDNILLALGEIVEVSDISTVDEGIVVDALDAVCGMAGRVDRLCVGKLFDEVCARLEESSDCNHSRNIALLRALATFKYRRPLAIELIQERLRDNAHTANTVELCRYMSLAAEAARGQHSAAVPLKLSVANVRAEAMKAADKLLGDRSLATQFLIGCLGSSRPFEDILENVALLQPADVLRLYEAIAHARADLDPDVTEGVERFVKHAWGLSPQMTATEAARLMRCGRLDVDSAVGADMLHDTFHRVMSEMEALPADSKAALLDFCSSQVIRDRRERFAKKILAKLEAEPASVPRNAAAAAAVLDIYEL
ncbi:hypothetical protein, conserved [Babesia bigemina]|uniref:Uncharacterized protein n=1 Tax=Babesia bigemina TaxID=5866 RepID=A0A061D4L6_BABBI|nr:hypothetical protein, conserved [Babesia bigemina]CDR93884.1 hypothetical protein, conserved [Babesia bigemina]|eukprot:XP_012766070.1 hypothetical protein, conserved [Babesia bigemina]